MGCPDIDRITTHPTRAVELRCIFVEWKVSYCLQLYELMAYGLYLCDSDIGRSQIDYYKCNLFPRGVK